MLTFQDSLSKLRVQRHVGVLMVEGRQLREGLQSVPHNATVELGYLEAEADWNSERDRKMHVNAMENWFLKMLGCCHARIDNVGPYRCKTS